MMCIVMIEVVVNIVVVNYYFGFKQVFLEVVVYCLFGLVVEECRWWFDVFEFDSSVEVIVDVIISLLIERLGQDLEFVWVMWLIGWLIVDFDFEMCMLVKVEVYEVEKYQFGMLEYVLLEFLCEELWLCVCLMFVVIGVYLMGVFENLVVCQVGFEEF